KSMQGEELDAAEVTAHGLLGDRQFALRDGETGLIAGAKNPRRWPGFLAYRAAFVQPPRTGSELPAVRVTLPDGREATTVHDDLATLLSQSLGREVTVERAEPTTPARSEEYWPDVDGLEHRETVTDWELPEATFS